jgi:uncharacterized membrane protein YtjA (UPF0391 family)
VILCHRAVPSFGVATLPTSGNQTSGRTFRKRDYSSFQDWIPAMLKWALFFLVVSIIAGLFGFTGISAASAGIAKILFFVAIVVFLIFLVLALTAGKAIL